jgi:hypothetical protein
VLLDSNSCQRDSQIHSKTTTCGSAKATNNGQIENAERM